MLPSPCDSPWLSAVIEGACSPLTVQYSGRPDHGTRTPVMCLLALFFRMVEDAPLVAGANREEAYARGGSPPQILDGPCRAVAGLDPLAGGTWFGVNEHGV